MYRTQRKRGPSERLATEDEPRPFNPSTGRTAMSSYCLAMSSIYFAASVVYALMAVMGHG